MERADLRRAERGKQAAQTVKYISLRQLLIWPVTGREVETICGLRGRHQALTLGN